MSDTPWFHDARFGLFIHFGPYAVLERGEWVMNQEGMTPDEYAPAADALRASPAQVRDWCRLARESGMRYAVLTTKHHDGFCLWDSRRCAFNAVRRGPGFDLVRVFTEACRAEGLRVGLYYSLADWTHPDGARCAHDEAARVRFTEYTRDLVRELCTGYGPLDLLWFDGPWPLDTAARWDSPRLLEEIRHLQPACLVNNRMGRGLEGDFGTPEGHIQAESRPWEACMTFNGDWGWSTAPDEDWRSPREVARLLQSCAAQGGNLLLNIGPKPDGSVPPAAVERLQRTGRWLQIHGEACLGPKDRIAGRLPAITNTGFWTLDGCTAWFWLARSWCSPTLALGGLRGTLREARLLHDPARRLTWDQSPLRTRIHGLPESNTEPELGIPVLRLEFEEPPSQVLPYPGCAV
jgi:alpha-L-fucosidase